MQNKKVIGQNLKALRTKLGFSQESIAKYLGIGRETISYYESGTRTITMEQMEKLADLFGVELYDLFEEEKLERKMNVAFAFRANSINDDDLKVIANFKKIIKNYLRIIKISKRVK